MSRQNPRPERALRAISRSSGGEEEAAVEEPGQRVDGGQPDRGVARAALFAGDDHRHIGEQDHGRQVDPDHRDGRGRGDSLRRSEDHREQVAERGDRGQRDRDRRGDHQRGATDDEREGEEERAGHATGQGDQHRRDGDRDRALQGELGRPEGVLRQQVVDDEHEHAGQDHQQQDGRLVLRPEAADRHDRGGREEEDPAARSARPGRRCASRSRRPTPSSMPPTTAAAAMARSAATSGRSLPPRPARRTTGGATRMTMTTRLATIATTSRARIRSTDTRPS